MFISSKCILFQGFLDSYILYITCRPNDLKKLVKTGTFCFVDNPKLG